MVVEHGPHYTSIDKWTGEYDDDYCYSCQKFVEADMDGKCPICETDIEFVDEYASGDVAKTTISSAPSVSESGDIWHRTGSGYTWGQGSTWNRYSGSSFSGMWGGSWSHTNNDSASRMLKHKNHLDSLCKVVDPNVKHTITFATASTGYTNMRTGKIVIDGTLLQDNDDKLDIVAGLSIHEKLHLIHTQPLTTWEREYVYEHRLKQFEEQLLHSIANSVEDEYIEKQLAKDCAGFVHYITATKEYYFNEKVKDMLDKPNDNPYLDLMNTLLALIRYPENINADRKKRHAKHIQFFARALKNALDDRKSVIKAIETLFNYMKQVAEKTADSMPEDESWKDETSDKMKELRDKLGDSELSEEDWKHIEKKVESDAKKDVKEGWDKLLGSYKDRKAWGSICGSSTYDPPKDSDDHLISDKLAKDIEDLADSDYHETELGKSEALNSKQTKTTWKNALADGLSKDVYLRDSKKMKPITNSLKRKIDLYGNTQMLSIRNQKRGKLDKRMLHRIPTGRQDLFKNDIINEDKPLDVCLLVDESGSMGYHMQDARRSCIAIKEALADNPKLNLWVMGHTADGEKWHNNPNTTNMTVYHSPKLKDRAFAMGGMRARCENRDGNAILSAGQKVKEESDSPMSNKLMIVFSDGSPAAIGYGGRSGIDHTRKCVKSLESKGWSIIQVGFGGATYQGDMFSNHIFVNDTAELSNKVSKIIRKVIKV